MKKIIALVFALIFVLAAFCGCETVKKAEDITLTDINNANTYKVLSKKYGSYTITERNSSGEYNTGITKDYCFIDYPDSDTVYVYTDKTNYKTVDGKPTAWMNLGYDSATFSQEKFSKAVLNDTNNDKIISLAEETEDGFRFEVTYLTPAQLYLGDEYVEGDVIITKIVLDKNLVLKSLQDAVLHSDNTVTEYSSKTIEQGVTLSETCENLVNHIKNADKTATVIVDKGTKNEKKYTIKFVSGDDVIIKNSSKLTLYSDEACTVEITDSTFTPTDSFTLYAVTKEESETTEE